MIYKGEKKMDKEKIEAIAKEIVEVLHKHGLKDDEGGLQNSNYFIEIDDKVWDLWTSDDTKTKEQLEYEAQERLLDGV